MRQFVCVLRIPVYLAEPANELRESSSRAKAPIAPKPKPRHPSLSSLFYLCVGLTYIHIYIHTYGDRNL